MQYGPGSHRQYETTFRQAFHEHLWDNDRKNPIVLSPIHFILGFKGVKRLSLRFYGL